MSLGIEYGGFSSYCVTNYKMQPKMMSKEGINKAFEGYLNLKNAKGGGKGLPILYNERYYETVTGACKEVCINTTSFINFCNKTTGKTLSELSLEERSKLFETYASAKGKF